MKTKKIKTITLVWLIGLLTIISCSKIDNNPSISNQAQSQAENNVQNGTWTITKFIDSGDDDVDHFTGYIFTFGSDEYISATNGSNTYYGSWRITYDNSNDDSQEDLDFIITFNLTNDFEDLNEDWNMISQTPTKIELIHVSGGNGGTDYLTFEKN